MFTAHRSSIFIIPLDHHDTDIYLFQKFVFIILVIQLGQLRLKPPGLGSKCGKRVERLSDF